MKNALQLLDEIALKAARRTLARSQAIKCLFQAGFNKGVSFQPTGGANTPIAITRHSWEEAIDKVDITNTSTQGVQALLASVLRGSGNVEAFFDSAALPFAAAPSIKAGQNGVCTFNLGAPNTQFIVPSMIIKVHYSSEVAGGVKYSFDLELNCLAGAAQTFVNYVYPT